MTPLRIALRTEVRLDVQKYSPGSCVLQSVKSDLLTARRADWFCATTIARSPAATMRTVTVVVMTCSMKRLNLLTSRFSWMMSEGSVAGTTLMLCPWPPPDQWSPWYAFHAIASPPLPPLSSSPVSSTTRPARRYDATSPPRACAASTSE